ncbi:MAG: penicillin-binding protein activator [Pararhodobacter sp.]|nr:penicillin-binding protein activator [Pararhodobacter sp.]
MPSNLPSLPRRRFLGALPAVAATVFLAACDPVGFAPTTSPRVDTAAPVQVALLVPGGSGDSGRQVLASSLENAARLAVADLSGVQVDLRVYETAGNPQQAAAVATRAVSEGARIILGPVFSGEASAVGAAVAGSGINVLSFSNNTEIAGGNVFVIGNTFDNTARRLLDYAASEGRGQIMIVADRTPEGAAAEASINRAASASGAAIVATERYSFSQQGIVDALPSISSTARSSGAQTILFTANTAGALPMLAQLLPENRVGPPRFQFMGLTRWDIPPATLELRGLQGGWFALPDPDVSARFERRYRDAYGSAPHPIAGLAYDGVAAIGALIGTGRQDAFSTAALTQASGFVGVNGVFRLRSDGGNDRALAVATIRDNEVVILDRAPRAFGAAGS